MAVRILQVGSVLVPAPGEAAAQLLHDEIVAEARGADQVQLTAVEHLTRSPHHPTQADLNLT